MAEPTMHETRARSLFEYLVRTSVERDDADVWQSLFDHLMACLSERQAISKRHIAEATVELTAEMEADYA